ncbi:putative bifunctional diguanylate cyclase/phosphodiesterase [Altericroceibacterium indicum]|uniref:putative bifunctional diguanylate cyclase/phosphodiesterase n=1 Tax=Altericroceibacterium indicum TaxID=374177 RepID=UPI001FE76CC1|nr:EAL domain-containing protein [Altericroceibacterium indicum]
MANINTIQKNGWKSRFGRSERDVIALGIAFAALILFVGIGGRVLPQAALNLAGKAPAPDPTMVCMLLLNIAIFLLGWRHYKSLQRTLAEVGASEQEALKLAAIDHLTGCHNRRSIRAIIDEMILTARKNDSDVALLLLDLDNFKHINDLNGHQLGDCVLVETANRLKMALPPEGEVARIGGDEFICVLPFKGEDREAITALANRLVRKVSEPIELNGESVEVTMSLGIAQALGDPASKIHDAEELLHHADVAMYFAKNNGRNNSAWFENRMNTEFRFRRKVENGIRHGVARGEFVPFYQKQVDLETGELVGFEMLARWKSRDFGMVSPDTFIPIAEKMGIISDISERLIKQALKDALEWDPKITLSVNISPIQLRDPWFAQKLLRLVVENGFPPERLDIEITESCLHDNIAAVRNVLVSLKNQGIHVTLDDFGTGYSSLAQLRALPFDRLKIDRSFVHEMSRQGGNTKLVEAIVSLGAGLNLPIVAEGIEDEDTLATLRAFGAMKGQGFLYGQPEDARKTLELLAATKPSKPTLASTDTPQPLEASDIRKVGPSHQ